MPRLQSSPRGRRQQKSIITGEHRNDSRLLQGPQLSPAKRADQVMGQRRMKPRQLGQKSSSTSSADDGRKAAALRSTSVSSAAERVS